MHATPAPSSLLTRACALPPSLRLGRQPLDREDDHCATMLGATHIAERFDFLIRPGRRLTEFLLSLPVASKRQELIRAVARNDGCASGPSDNNDDDDDGDNNAASI